VQNKPHTLRRKLLTWLLLPLLILFFIRAGYTYYYANELATRVYDRILFTLTVAISQQIIFDSANQHIELPQTAIELLISDEIDQLYFTIRDAQGNIIDGDRRMLSMPNSENEQDDIFFSSRIDGQDIRVAQLDLTIGHKPYLLQVAETLTKRSLLSREFKYGVLLPQILIIILATLIIWFGIGKSLAPLKRLQKAVSVRSHRDLSPLTETDVSAEVQPLVHAINDLLAQLSEVLEAQNRFIADAAHQLRTPLAGLKTQIELALRQNDVIVTAQTMPKLLVSADRMTRLVNQLLALARNEPNVESAIQMVPLDLGALASNLTMEWVPLALAKDIDLGFEAPQSKVIIQGDAARIKDLIDNLIDNAVRYTDPHGQITVCVSNGDKPQLSVTDTGPGISAEHRERVFERFYSVLGNTANGSGLGLAIVREIARMHGATTHIDSATNGSGTRISVVF
jgi:two-component system sensor histidine kinase TctE